MLRIIRDTAALVELEKQLQKVREMQLRAVHDGRPMSAAELKAAEDRAVAQVKREYYCPAARMAFLPADQAAALTDDQDYQARQNADNEFCFFDSHHRLLSLPCAGAPEYIDPDPPISVGEAGS